MDEKGIIAIMGPSGSGKTTLANNLSKRNGIIIPRHVTTRSQRIDDAQNFYRYLSHEEYNEYFKNEEFLISSGDGPKIQKEYGNFYGVLIDDCNKAWELSDLIILFTSYKDIRKLVNLKNTLDVNILNITFNNIEENVRLRIANRNESFDSIERRIYWALKDEEDYRKEVDLYATASIYTDLFGIEETYEKACKVLKLKRY